LARKYVQIAPGNFEEPQQRAVNDALGQLSTLPTATRYLVPVPRGTSGMPITVSMVTATYAVAGSVNWDTTWKWTGKTSTRLTVAFSNPPADDGAFLDLTLTE